MTECWQLKHRESDGRLVAVDPETGTAKPLIITETDLEGSDIVGVGEFDAESIAVGGGTPINRIERGVETLPAPGAAPSGASGSLSKTETEVSFESSFEQVPFVVGEADTFHAGNHASTDNKTADGFRIRIDNYSQHDPSGDVDVHWFAFG